jgi:glycosyltransferase involved in cell wall biosynthesis
MMNTSNEPFVSIVTPVYNREKYIAECIESVLKQTYNNWEYVIVNNVSTDRTLEIAEGYAAADSRIKIHTNENHLPLMSNLNNAFRFMSGSSKYCKVIHSDDWMFPECIEKMVAVAEGCPEVGIVSSYRLDNDRVGLSGLPYPSQCVPGKEIARKYLISERYYFGSPSTLLIRSDLVRKREMFYDEDNIHSDISVCLDILREADFGFVHQVLTYTRRHASSVSSTIVKESYTDMLSWLKDLVNYGPDFLTEREMSLRLQQRLRIFYIRLARRILMEKNLSFVSGYRSELNDLGLKFSRSRLLMRTIAETVRLPAIKLMQK